MEKKGPRAECRGPSEKQNRAGCWVLSAECENQSSSPLSPSWERAGERGLDPRVLPRIPHPNPPPQAEEGINRTTSILVLPRPSALSFEFLAHAAQLNRRDMNALAAAGALASIVGHRRQAAWEVTGVEPRPPVLRGAPIHETTPALTVPSEGEDLIADYASLGLTLGRHPMALLRGRLDAMQMSTAEKIKQLPHGKRARAAGIVIGRQRPDTASGVIFVTLEDETGTINIVVWNRVAERQRRALLGSQLMAVHGVIEREGEVVHLVAGKLVDHSALLGRLTMRSRDFH